MDFFSKEEADVIGEISNISIGSSATAMNLMLGQPITITTPHVTLAHKNDILEDYENSCILVRVQYTEGLFGTNMLVLKDDDARIITDLMMGNGGTGEYSQGDITPLHISAVSEAMNQMTASSATAMSKMFQKKIDISPPSVQQIIVEDYEFPEDIREDLFVKINFKLRALKMGAPVIGLLDCAGMRLQEATDALAGFGNLYMKQAMASGVIPQITAVFGNCGGGLSVVPALADFTFMEGKDARLFVNSPNAIPGNDIGKCDTSSAKYQSEEAGLVDGVGTEDEIFANIRSLVCMLPGDNAQETVCLDCTDDLNRACAGIENAVEDTAIAFVNISDNGVFFETKRAYARDMVTGFIQLNGMTVGAVANRSKVFDSEANVVAEFDGSLSAKGARKAAEFVEFCDAFNIPVLTLTNVNGFTAGKCSERNLAKAAAKLVYTFANATVPKVNVVIGKAFGSAYVAMNSKAVGADMVYAWPTAEIGMMDANLAVKIMYAGADKKLLNEKAAEYKELQSSPMSAARRGYVDTVIQPADTRKYVIGAFEMLFTKREVRPLKKHGTV